MAPVEVADLPVVDVGLYLESKIPGNQVDAQKVKEECKKVAGALHKFGCVVVRDPRVKDEDNNKFLDMMEKYFEASDFKRDARPELGFQVGVTPEHTERPRNHCKRAESLPESEKPLTPCPPELDAKSRFFWRAGERPAQTSFKELNAEPVIPDEFPEWETTMNAWSEKMLAAVSEVAGMAAEGFDLPPETFRERMKYGPHLLAPTGSDFKKFGQEGTILAGYHYDLNFLTIHAKSRFPGLYVWLRDNTRVRVKVPDGCLLVQAGKQCEYLTGGHVLAGFHEVIVAPETVEVIERKKKAGESLWRVSSTLFGHIASDVVLEPLGHFKKEDSVEKFPPIKAGDQVMDELREIKLGTGFTLNGKDLPPGVKQP